MKCRHLLALTALCGFAVACSTRAPEDELPEVLSPLPWDTCPAVRVGKAVSEGETYFLDGDGLTDCANAELEACRKGRVAYRFRISRQGLLLGLEFQEPRVPAVEKCVAQRLQAAIFMPAVDCTLVPVDTVFEGAVAWNPDVGISEAVPGMAGIVPALPACALPAAAQQRDEADEGS